MRGTTMRGTTLTTIAVLALAAGCGRIDVGSDLLWTARFETADFSEWTTAPGGKTRGVPDAAQHDRRVERQRPHAVATPPR